MWVQVTLSGLNMGGLGVQLKCAHKIKSLNMFCKNNPKHPGQSVCKMARGGQLFSDDWVLSQMLNHGHKEKLMNTEQHDPLKWQNCITLPYLESLIFSTNTLYFPLWILLYYCTLTALCSLHENELVQHFVWKCESLSLS